MPEKPRMNTYRVMLVPYFTVQAPSAEKAVEIVQKVKVVDEKAPLLKMELADSPLAVRQDKVLVPMQFDVIKIDRQITEEERQEAENVQAEERLHGITH